MFARNLQLVARRRVAAPLVQQRRGVKQSTHIVGLPVEPNAVELLRRVYEETLVAAKTLPECHYRKALVDTANERLGQIREANGDADALERLVNLGQIEEVLADAKAELDLVPELVASGQLSAGTFVALSNGDVARACCVRPPPPPFAPQRLRLPLEHQQAATKRQHVKFVRACGAARRALAAFGCRSCCTIVVAVLCG